MLRRLYNWILRKLRKAAPLNVERVLPEVKVKPNTRLDWLTKMALARQKRKNERHKFVEEEANRKAAKTNVLDCACGCGTKMAVPASTLHFFASREHRKYYRKYHGAIDYGSVKR